jgi:hypothetical protein
MSQRNGARELGLIVALVAVSAHFLDLMPAIAVTALAALATAAGTARLIGGWVPWREPLFPLALPVLAAFSITGLARFVGPALWLVAIAPIGWLAVAWIVDLELYGFFKPPPGQPAADELPRPVRRIRTRRRPESELPQLVVEEAVLEPETPPHPRALAIRSAAVALSFLGFVAAAGFVPGALGDVGQALPFRDLVTLVVIDAIVAGLAGYRISALVAPSAIDRMVRVLAVVEYAVPVGFATWGFRTLGLPRLFVPALLTLAVYMITVMRESSEPILSNGRLLRELGVLTLAAVLAVAWGLMAR